MSIKVLIVDDEPRAHTVLQNYIARMPELELAGDCYNAIEAYQFLKREEVQIIFRKLEIFWKIILISY